MSQPLIAKPLLALLLLTAITSVVLSQRPDTAQDDATADLLADPVRLQGDPKALTPDIVQIPAPWLRKPIPMLTQTHDARPAQPEVPPPPPPLFVPPPPPPAPVAPSPGFVYLGRLVDAGKTTVFIAAGDDFKAVAIGSTIDSDWRLLGASGKALKLLYLPLNENKELPLSQ